MALTTVTPSDRDALVATPGDLSGLDFLAGFPTPEMVRAGASMLAGSSVRLTDDHGAAVRVLGATGRVSMPPGPRGAAARKSAELYPEAFAVRRRDLFLREGPVWRLEVAPGLLAVRSSDWARLERTAERAVETRRRLADLLSVRAEYFGPACVRCEHDSCCLVRSASTDPDALGGRGCVVEWSARSRSRLREKMASLDYSPMREKGRPAAMVTLTVPGEWEHLVPDAGKGVALLGALRKRYARSFGEPLVAVWKREFQRRGAPHWHLFMVPPAHASKCGLPFRVWLSRTWAALVAGRMCETCASGSACGQQDEPLCERRSHVLAGTGVDYREGGRSSDPRRLATYFAKHGLFGAKEYQNQAPPHWVESGSVGRFWGVWGLADATVAVTVQPARADAARRTLRRWFRAQGRTAPVNVWRSKHDVDPETHEVRSARWRKRRQTRRVRLLGGSAGFMVLNDGPAMASQIGRYLAQIDGPGPSRPSGSGPRGWLP